MKPKIFAKRLLESLSRKRAKKLAAKKLDRRQNEKSRASTLKQLSDFLKRRGISMSEREMNFLGTLNYSALRNIWTEISNMQKPRETIWAIEACIAFFRLSRKGEKPVPIEKKSGWTTPLTGFVEDYLREKRILEKF